MTKNNIEINNKLNRNNLGEGKNYQMGFGLLKKIEENKFENVSPISACREYLNDMIYCELTKIVNNEYGLECKFNDLFKEEKLYMSSSILKRRSNTTNGHRDYVVYNGYEDDLENFKTVSEKIQSFLNKIEDYLNVKEKTIVTKLEDNLILFEFDKIWGSSTYAISLYSLLARVAQKYNDSDCIEYLIKFKDNYGDAYNANSLPQKLLFFKESGFPVQNKLTSSYIHSAGIMNFENYKKK